MAGRVIAAWPSFALTASYELLMRQIRQSGAAATTGQRGTQRIEIGAGGRPKVDVAAEAPLLPSDDVDPVVPGRSDGSSAARAVGGGGRILQRQAWQWALANRRWDGSLPTGTEVAQQFRRSERWGRLVKNTGLTGQFGTDISLDTR